MALPPLPGLKGGGGLPPLPGLSKANTLPPLPGLSNSNQTQSKALDTNEPRQLLKLAEKSGISEEAKEVVENKPTNALGKLVDLLSRGTYTSANIAKELTDKKKSSPLDVIKAGLRGLKGQDKTTYSDVLEQAGVKNKYVRGIAGFTGDVLLDPTTYVGGSVVKGVIKGAAKGVTTAGKVAGKTAIGAKAINTGAKVTNPIRDALGTAFKFGYKTSDGLADETMATLRNINRTKSGIAESAIKRFKGVSKLDEDKLFKALTETRIKEFAARKKATTTGFVEMALSRAKELGASDGAVKVMRGELDRAAQLAKKAGVENPYEAYFPFLKKENLTKLDESAKALRVGSEGYLKKFQAKLNPDDIINSVPEAYARREYQVVRDKITRDSLAKIVKNYGKQFASEEDAFKAGYRAVKEKGQFGKVIGYLKEADKKFIDNIYNPELESIDKLAKASGYDSFNRLWKTAVTKYFPSFHARNWVSGITQNYEAIGRQALNPLTHKEANKVLRVLGGKESDSLLKFGGNAYKTKYLAKEFRNMFGDGNWKNIADLGDEIAAGRSGLKLKDFAKKGVSKLDYGSKAGEWVETQQKMVAFIGALKNGKKVKEALKIAERAGFDYSKITKFEQKVLKRLIPFYTFARKNIELQGRTLINNPERVANIAKTFTGLDEIIGGGGPEEERSGLPRYVQEGLNIRTQDVDKYGRPIYITTGGTGLEAATQLFSGNPFFKVVSQTNPVIKYAFERATGIDTFRSAGGDLTKTIDVKNADKYAKAPKVLKDWLQLREVKKPIYVDGKPSGTRVGYEANPDRLRLLQSLPTSRFVGSIADLQDPGKTIKEKALILATGIRTYPADTKQQNYYESERQRKALTELLIKAGVLKEFNKAYVPKK